ncbi:MAG: alpha/beta fold hydrolase [Aureliella sp.]
MTLEVGAAGPESGPLVIMLHGFPDFWQGWHLQLRPLAAAGLRVLAPNQRGYGESDKPPRIGDYDIERLAEDVVALADSEQRSTFSLVGHDWGGIVAWWVAARFPERVERLAVLNAPHPGAFKSYLMRSATQMFRSWYVAFFQLPWLPEALLSAHHHALMFRAVQGTSLPGVFDDSDRRYLERGWSCPGSLTAMLNYYRAICRRSTASLQRKVEVPTLLLFGRHDPTEEPGLATASATLCDHCRLVELEQARHWLQREQPDRINEELLAFLPVPTGVES